MFSELEVQRNIYNKDFPNFGRPQVIGYIGLENLKYAKNIKNQPVNLDLNLQLDKAKHHPPDRDVKLNDLLKFLLECKLNFPPENSLQNAKFYCYRGLMTLVACTPYENREPWKITVILHKGNIYLCARDTEDKLRRKMNMSKEDKKFTSWGYKFEQFILSDTPDSLPNPDQPLDETKEFSLVFTTNLNRHKIVYGAEMDGIYCDKTPISKVPGLDLSRDEVVKTLASKEYIELKTNRLLEFSRQETNFRQYKTKKWWCQSFLAGVNTILCGFRNDQGIVEQLEIFNVNDLPKMSQRFWSPNVCFNFLDTFFTYVKRCLSKEIKRNYGEQGLNNLQSLPMITLMLHWFPQSTIQVDSQFVYEDDSILPDWFLEKNK